MTAGYRSEIVRNKRSLQPVGKMAEGRGRPPPNPKTTTGIETPSEEWPTPTPAKNGFSRYWGKKWTYAKIFYYIYADKRWLTRCATNSEFLLQTVTAYSQEYVWRRVRFFLRDISFLSHSSHGDAIVVFCVYTALSKVHIFFCSSFFSTNTRLSGLR